MRIGRALLLAVLLVACSSQRGTIGAVIGQSTDGKLTLRQVPRGLGAAKAGLEPGDQILLIDGVDVRTLDERGLQELLTGEVGQPVKLTVVRGKEVLRVTVLRTPARRWRP